MRDFAKYHLDHGQLSALANWSFTWSEGSATHTRPGISRTGSLEFRDCCRRTPRRDKSKCTRVQGPTCRHLIHWRLLALEHIVRHGDPDRDSGIPSESIPQLTAPICSPSYWDALRELPPLDSLNVYCATAAPFAKTSAGIWRCNFQVIAMGFSPACSTYSTGPRQVYGTVKPVSSSAVSRVNKRM